MTTITFTNLLNECATQNGWVIADMDYSQALLRFKMCSGRLQILHIKKYGSTVEFSVPSIAAFDSLQSMPHHLSTLLLQKSAEKYVGFWCINKIGEKYVYSHMHNVDMESINTDSFGKVVTALIKECDRFEASLFPNLNR